MSDMTSKASTTSRLFVKYCEFSEMMIHNPSWATAKDSQRKDGKEALELSSKYYLIIIAVFSTKFVCRLVDSKPQLWEH